MQKIFITLLFLFIGLFGTAQTPDYSDVKFDQKEMLQLVNEARMTKRRCGGKSMMP